MPSIDRTPSRTVVTSAELAARAPELDVGLNHRATAKLNFDHSDPTVAGGAWRNLAVSAGQLVGDPLGLIHRHRHRRTRTAPSRPAGFWCRRRPQRTRRTFDVWAASSGGVQKRWLSLVFTGFHPMLMRHGKPLRRPLDRERDKQIR